MSTPTPDPEVVVIKEKPDSGDMWMWVIFGIVLLAIILIILGVCLSNKHHKKLVYVNANTSVPPSMASSGSNSYLQGGASFLAGGSALSVAPISMSVLNSSTAPMSFMPY
jgi:hypothetical protein